MTYRVLSDYRAGMPRTPKDGKPWRLIACHWTAGAAGYAGAVGTIGYFIQTAATRNASYHELWAYDEASDVFSVIRIVPPTHCAHSLNPQQPPNGPYDPDAWVRQALGANWYDPNQGVYAVSIAGGATECARYAGSPKFIGHALRRIGEIRAEIPGLVGLAEHSRFQTNKADWGPALVPKLGGVRFAEALPDTSLPEDDMPTILRAFIGKKMTFQPGAEFRKAPDFGTKPYYTATKVVEIQPFAVVAGDRYNTADGTSNRWAAFVASDLSLAYIPVIYGRLSNIAPATTTNAVDAALTAAKGAQQAINATVTALEQLVVPGDGGSGA